MGLIVASASDDETVKLWDVAEKKQITTLDAHTSLVLSVSFSPDGNILASASRDRTVRLWDVATGEQIARFVHTGPRESGPIQSPTVAFSPNGAVLASGSGGGTVRLWNTTTRKEIATFFGHTRQVSSVAVSPDGTILASGSLDGTVLLWDLTKSQRRPYELVKISGDKQKGPMGSELENPFVVIVRDQFGDPLSRAQVRFTVISGSGTLAVEHTLTGSEGRATSRLTVGRELGATSIEVTVAGTQHSLTFVVRALPSPDFDGDGNVGFADFLNFVSVFGLNWGTVGYDVLLRSGRGWDHRVWRFSDLCQRVWQRSFVRLIRGSYTQPER